MEVVNLNTPHSSIPKPDDVISNSKSSPAKTVATVNGSAPEKKLTKSVSWKENLVTRSSYSAPVHPEVAPFPGESNAYVSRSSSPSLSNSASFKDRMDTMRNVLGKWSQNVKVATKRAEDLAENTWQHFKTSPSLGDAAMGRLVHSTKVVAEGGYEKIFFRTFDTLPEELLRHSYACYLSTSAGPIMGTLYVSTYKLAFCSDNPLPYKHADRTEWSYYKVNVPLEQLKAVNRSSNRLNAAEKYIQIITISNHEFWYMGFFKYEDALSIIQATLEYGNVQSI